MRPNLNIDKPLLLLVTRTIEPSRLIYTLVLLSYILVDCYTLSLSMMLYIIDCSHVCTAAAPKLKLYSLLSYGAAYYITRTCLLFAQPASRAPGAAQLMNPILFSYALHT